MHRINTRIFMVLATFALVFGAISFNTVGALAYDKPSKPAAHSTAVAVNSTEQSNLALGNKGSVTQLNANQTTQNVVALVKGSTVPVVRHLDYQPAPATTATA